MLEMPTLRRNVSVSTLEAMDQSSMKWDSLQEYVEKHGGSRVISRILIANNGIAAVKCMQSMRRWEYGELGLKNSLSFICMATPEDIKANAEFVRMADEVVEVPGGSNNNNYANVDLIVDIAQRKNVDAVWAGWGHASENPNLPNKLARDQKRNIVFLGPGGTAMNALGDKVGSSIIAQSAGVPCIEWSGSDVNIGEQIAAGSTEIPRETYLKACVTTVEEAVAKSAHVGFPLMVKASEGGGGKGIRKVMHVGELPDAFLQVKAEVVGSPIFLMRLFAGGRHIEVQVLADLHGNVVTLNGRDCSIQRRHQKIIEEGPPVAADPIAFARMEKAAASLAQAVGYAGVGTVEYLYRDGEFYFLEMNPRLQVEHTVTELINDINLPLAMLLVGMGIPMHRIPDIRTLWGMPDRHGSMVIDFDIQLRNPPKCHTIAARITAENPDTGFRPTSGVLQEINFRVSPQVSRHKPSILNPQSSTLNPQPSTLNPQPSTLNPQPSTLNPQVWGYFSVSGRGAVHEFADSQFGHIFSVGSTRESARKHLILALRDLTIYGAIRTTTQYLIAMLELDDYKHNKIDTQVDAKSFKTQPWTRRDLSPTREALGPRAPARDSAEV
jgi:acetyl-CoA carboxylase/biotin carboxylase 1